MSCCETEICAGNKEKKQGRTFLLTILGVFLVVVARVLQLQGLLEVGVYLIGYIMVGYTVLFSAFQSILRRKFFDENTLMTIATVGAFFIGDYLEGVSVMVFYRVGEMLQDFSVNRSKKQIEASLNLRQEIATISVENELKQVDPKSLKIGDRMVVKTGEKVAVDGVLRRGVALLDRAMLTGESLPCEVAEKEAVLSGSINLGGTIEVEVTASYDDSTVTKMLAFIQNAQKNKSKSEKFITKFARIYTPIVIFIALFIAIVPGFFDQGNHAEYVRRALIFLVISCPCALVLSIPLGYFAGIGACGRRGILVKGSNFLDALTDVSAIVFDKTGTLTKGSFEVTQIKSVQENGEEAILQKIALVESFSSHPIAQSIVRKFDGILETDSVEEHEEIAGYGIVAKVAGVETLVGNAKLMQKFGVDLTCEERFTTMLYLAEKGVLQGTIEVSDVPKKGSKRLMQKLKEKGIHRLVMLSGDNQRVAEMVAEKIGLPEVYAELLPMDKVSKLKEIKQEIGEKQMVFVGDGLNDSPALALADVGIVMTKGADLAVESADIVLMTNDPMKIIDALAIAQKTRRAVQQNIVVAIGIKIFFLILSGFGFTTMWEAVFADVGVTFLAVINVLRVMKE